MLRNAEAVVPMKMRSVCCSFAIEFLDTFQMSHCLDPVTYNHADQLQTVFGYICTTLQETCTASCASPSPTSDQVSQVMVTVLLWRFS